ncbi:RNA-binding protein Musashi homolog 2-like isoform X2 [Montipora capricornis]|uniref:RNA-binding protein Musashi homolog 2-like isoform X2 n=1 Tax=Montipora foliosa TaxID=591990 RepID=UPI0035F16122
MIRPKMVRGTNRGDDIGKIFVGGLSTETTKESLQDYFSAFGEVSDCIVMKDTVSKRSRGFGFVTFADPSSVDNVCQKPDHILDNKKIDPKRAVPRGPGQQAVISQQSVGGPPSKDSGNNENKIFVGGLGGNATEEELRRFFSVFGKVVHVKLMYDKETSRMRGFGFVTFDSSEAVEEAVRTRYHDFNGKTVEAKKAEQQQPRGMGQGGNMGMAGGQMNAGYGRGQYGYPQQPGMVPPSAAMGRGYPGYGAMAPGYPGANPMVGTAYGYGMGAQAVPGYGVDQSSIYGAQAGSAAAGAFGPGYGSAPTSAAASMAATSGYADYGQMSAASQGAMAGGPPGAQPRLDTPGAPDYTAYGLGNYQQQESSYGPARSSFSSDTGSYGNYGGADQANYGTSYPHGGGGAGGEPFGRGGGNVSRGYHPYGR